MLEGFEHALAGEAIQAPEEHQVKLALRGILKHPPELPPLPVLPARAIDILAGQPPPLGLLAPHESPQVAEVVLDFLALING